MHLKFRKLFPITIVLLFGLIAAWPLFQRGFIPTHDGEYHLIRFHEFETMLKSGYWFPRWAPGLNNGYGVPLFNFNYPLPNYFGVLFHTFGFSLADSFKLTLAAGYLTAIIFCYLWLTKLFSKAIATAATIVFAYVPYWFVDIYIRGSVGEVLATAFLMLAFTAIERGWAPVLSIAIGLMILSHNILALIFLPIIIVYLLITKPKYWWTIAIGLGISAYFWVPALAEQKYVVGLNTVNYRDYFSSLAQLLIPSWGTGLFGSADIGNEMSVQIGVMPLLLLVTGIFFLVKDKGQKSNLKFPVFLGLAIISIFLMLKSSAIFWQIIPLLSFAQYPWRFLSLIVPSVAFIAAYIFTKFNKVWLMTVAALLTVVLSYSYSRPVIYEPRSDEYYLTRPNFTDGTNSLGNTFSTVWSPWKQVRPKSRVEFVSGSGRVDVQTAKPLNYGFSVFADIQSTLRLNVLYYPGWTVFVDGKEQTIDYKKEGLINFSLAKGQHKADIVFRETPVRRVSDGLSIISVLLLTYWILKQRFIRKNIYSPSVISA